MTVAVTVNDISVLSQHQTCKHLAPHRNTDYCKHQ